MTPEFARLVNPSFQYVLDLVDRVQRGTLTNLELERDRIKRKLEDAERTVMGGKHTLRREDFDLAQRAIVYWTDEVMTRATNDREQQWTSTALEREIYGERNGAVKFYEICEQQARHVGGDVLEVYYLAVVLGFQGDILEAFQRIRKPFPAKTTATRARSKWAAKLARDIPMMGKHGLLEEIPLEGDVQPLGAARVVKLLSKIAAVLLVSLAFLILCWLNARAVGE